MSEQTYGFCGSKCKHPIYTKEEMDKKLDRIAVFEGQISCNARKMGSHSGNKYPTGWNGNNTIVLSAMAKTAGNTTWECGNIGASGLTYDNLADLASWYIQPTVRLSTDASNFIVTIQNNLNAVQAYDYKVVLMRID